MFTIVIPRKYQEKHVWVLDVRLICDAFRQPSMWSILRWKACLLLKNLTMTLTLGPKDSKHREVWYRVVRQDGIAANSMAATKPQPRRCAQRTDGKQHHVEQRSNRARPLLHFQRISTNCWGR